MSELCEHCGHELRGLAMVGDALVCHPIDPYPDCYRLVTVYGETLGLRNVRRLRAAVDAALALHGRSKIQGWCNGCTDRYPCATVRALAPVADPDPHTTSDKETTT